MSKTKGKKANKKNNPNPNKNDQSNKPFFKKEQEKAKRAAAIEKSKIKRLEKTKVHSKKTKRGQPVMKDRIEFLLKKIQEKKK